MVILIRDRALDDKVVKVIEPLDTVRLTYNIEDEERRLAYVSTNWPNYNGVEVNQIHSLFYGPYLTSEDETITVLKKVQQSTEFGDKVLDNVKLIRSCKQCMLFDQLKNKVEQLDILKETTVGPADLDPDVVYTK